MTSAAELHGFAYGEEIEAETGRSIGCHLLTPTTGDAWAKEAEQLARQLQAAPYPEHWHPTDLFCSVLLADGRRLIASVRYGQIDHTPGKRVGGVEMIGVVGPGNLNASSALRIYHWLRRYRESVADLRTFGDRFELDEVLANAPDTTDGEPASPLPIQWNRDDVLLFWASSPADPDRRARMLSQDSSADWQWLPLCAADFPFEAYRRRGRLIAWLPPHVDVAQKWSPSVQSAAAAKINWPVVWTASGILLVLLAANLWALLSLHGRISAAPKKVAEIVPKEKTPAKIVVTNDSKEEFAHALYKILVENNAKWSAADSTARKRYRTLAASDGKLSIASAEGQALVGLTSLLSRYDPDQIAKLIEVEFQGKQGIDEDVVKLISRRVKQRLQTDLEAGP